MLADDDITTLLSPNSTAQRTSEPAAATRAHTHTHARIVHVCAGAWRRNRGHRRYAHSDAKNAQTRASWRVRVADVRERTDGRARSLLAARTSSDKFCVASWLSHAIAAHSGGSSSRNSSRNSNSDSSDDARSYAIANARAPSCTVVISIVFSRPNSPLVPFAK